MQKGVSLFNRKPSKGIEFLINNKRISGSPEEVAQFLKNTSGLNEAMIGDYLGEREEFSLKVMHAYVDSFNFGGMDFGEAIRFFLRGFRLPGEAQKIDRIMEKFAERYCKCNPNSFTSADTAYVLAYSVIMLNTDAHNSMVKDKVSMFSTIIFTISFVVAFSSCALKYMFFPFLLCFEVSSLELKRKKIRERHFADISFELAYNFFLVPFCSCYIYFVHACVSVYILLLCHNDKLL